MPHLEAYPLNNTISWTVVQLHTLLWIKQGQAFPHNEFDRTLEMKNSRTLSSESIPFIRPSKKLKKKKMFVMS